MSTERDTEENLERLRAVVRANPRSTAFVALAHALCDSGHDQEAEEVSRQGLTQHPRLVTGQVALGRALMGRGRLREAQDVLVDAAKSSPEHGDAFRWLGDLVLRKGARDRGRAILEYAEELMPTDPRVAELLVKAGGQPMPRAVRPKTDFEHTRVGNARALAERMHEDPPAAGAEAGKGPPTEGPTLVQVSAPGEEAGDDADESTDVANAPPEADESTSETMALDPESGSIEIAGDGDDDDGDGAGAEGEGSASSTAATTPRARVGGSAARPSRTRALMANVVELWQAQSPGTRLTVAIGGAVAGVCVIVLCALPGHRSRPALHPVVAQAPARTEPPPPPPPPPLDVAAALADGSADRLMEVRALGRRMLAGAGARDGDRLAEVALADAFLAGDFGLASTADANEAADAAAQVQPERPARTALVEAARALTALAQGHLAEASAAGDRAIAADPDSAAGRLARGRLKLRQGDLAGAREELEKARAASPEGTAVGLEWASLAIDSGDPATAAETLDALLARRPEELRARLLRAETARAAADPFETGPLREACRSEGRDHAVLRAACAAQSASNARLSGDRGPALRAAHQALAGGGKNPRALAEGALVLATLGDTDAAADALRKIQDETASGFPPRFWADLAVTLGRGHRPDATAKLVPNGPEARLVAARAAFASGGPKALALFLRELAPSAVTFDSDLATFAALVDEGKIAKATRADLEKRAQHGSALADYVLGRDLLAASDRRGAAKRLQRALKGHGDTCETAHLLSGIPKRLRPAALATDAKLARALQGHNASCSYFEK